MKLKVIKYKNYGCTMTGPELQDAFLLILMKGMKDDSLFQMKQTVVKETIKKPALRLLSHKN